MQPSSHCTHIMLILTFVLALAAIHASAVDCTGADKAKCTDLVVRSLDCYHHNTGTQNCTTVCSVRRHRNPTTHTLTRPGGQLQLLR